MKPSNQRQGVAVDFWYSTCIIPQKGVYHHFAVSPQYKEQVGCGKHFHRVATFRRYAAALKHW